MSSIIVTNTCPDPRCQSRRQSSNTTNVFQYAADSEKPGRWHYEQNPGASGSKWVSVTPNAASLQIGEVLYARVDHENPADFIRRQQNGGDRMTLIWHRVTGSVVECAWRITVGNTAHNITLEQGALDLLQAGCYSADDWERLLAMSEAGKIAFPWFAGPIGVEAGQPGPWHE